MRNLYDSGVFPRADDEEDIEILTGFFRNRKTKKGVREGGSLTINRAVIRGGLQLPPRILRVMETVTYDFDAEVPPALAELGMQVAAGERKVTERWRKSVIEFTIERLDESDSESEPESEYA
jgi:hypothetical protein